MWIIFRTLSLQMKILITSPSYNQVWHKYRYKSKVNNYKLPWLALKGPGRKKASELTWHLSGVLTNQFQLHLHYDVIKLTFLQNWRIKELKMRHFVIGIFPLSYRIHFSQPLEYYCCFFAPLVVDIKLDEIYNPGD